MRKPNVELKRIKLQQLKLQGEQYLNKISDLNAKLESVRVKHRAKVDQINALEEEISQLETTQVVTQTETDNNTYVQ